MNTIEQEADAIRTQRANIRAAETELEQRTRDLIGRMPLNLTTREIATLVGLSPQRVAQIAPGRRPRGRQPANQHP